MEFYGPKITILKKAKLSPILLMTHKTPRSPKSRSITDLLAGMFNNIFRVL